MVVVTHAFNHSTWGQRQVDLCEFVARLVYIVEFWASWGYSVRSYLKIAAGGFTLECRSVGLRVLAALSEVQSSIPATTWWLTVIYNGI